MLEDKANFDKLRKLKYYQASFLITTLMRLEINYDFKKNLKNANM